jgi:hypothetical protein
MSETLKNINTLMKQIDASCPKYQDKRYVIRDDIGISYPASLFLWHAALDREVVLPYYPYNRCNCEQTSL